jgi:predicted RNase H-like HicB family nuclease
MDAKALTVTVVYLSEVGVWWSEALEVPEFTGGGETFEQARELTREGLALTLKRPVELDERFDEAAIAARRDSIQVTATGSVQVRSGTLTWQVTDPVLVEPAIQDVASSRP